MWSDITGNRFLETQKRYSVQKSEHGPIFCHITNGNHCKKYIEWTNLALKYIKTAFIGIEVLIFSPKSPKSEPGMTTIQGRKQQWYK